MAEEGKRPVGRPVTTGITPKQSLRITHELWSAVGQAATDAGTDRAAITRAFYEWYLRRPGAKLPRRPEAS